MKSILFALLLAHLFALVVMLIEKDLNDENSPHEQAMEPRQDPPA